VREPPRIRVSDLRYAEAPEADQARGLIGRVRFVVNDALVVGGVALRRTRDGRFTLSWPSRRDARGEKRYFVHPISDAVRLDLERQVLEAMHLKQELAP